MTRDRIVDLPKTGFVRLPVILAHIPVGKSTWWDGVRSGRFPAPIRGLGPRITAWRAEDIHKLIKDLGETAAAPADSQRGPQ